MSLTVLSIALVGVLILQVLAVRSNHMARELGVATSLGRDLVENIGTWAYNDPRLATTTSVTSPTNAAVLARSDLGRATTVTDSAKKPHFGELAGTNALSNDALRSGGVAYDGLSPDIDRDGRPDFERYWSVFRLDPTGSGTEEGKLVVVVVRWFEGGLGYRQIVQTTFRSNAGAFSL